MKSLKDVESGTINGFIIASEDNPKTKIIESFDTVMKFSNTRIQRIGETKHETHTGTHATNIYGVEIAPEPLKRAIQLTGASWTIKDWATMCSPTRTRGQKVPGAPHPPARHVPCTEVPDYEPLPAKLLDWN